MSEGIVSSDGRIADAAGRGEVILVTTTVAEQLFGVPVQNIRCVLGPQSITRIPLAPPAVAGALNFRGRIVTAIDLRTGLGFRPRSAGRNGKHIVIEEQAGLYSLIVDSVDEVLRLSERLVEPVPVGLRPAWREIAAGVCRLKDRLIIALDIARLLRHTQNESREPGSIARMTHMPPLVSGVQP